jgi:hypothetical protein
MGFLDIAGFFHHPGVHQNLPWHIRNSLPWPCVQVKADFSEASPSCAMVIKTGGKRREAGFPGNWRARVVSSETVGKCLSDGYGSIPMKIPCLGGWTSINPSYFDVNRRGIGFWPIPRSGLMLSLMLTDVGVS